MPAMGVATRRRGKAVCLIAAIGLAIVGVVNAATAGATSTTAPATAATTPSYQFSTVVGAIGIQTALKQNPEPSSVPDMTDVQTPSSDAQLDSFGTSFANAHVVNLNGLGGLPALICLASPAFCNAIPVSKLTGGLIQGFPPSDPLNAASVYPQNTTASAPHVGTKNAELKIANGPLQVGDGTAQSTALQYSTSTDAVDGNVGLMNGISIGSVRTTTTQVANGSNVTTTATAELSNIGIGTGKLLQIGSVRSTLQVVTAPGKKATDTASSTVSGVKVLGLPATIDRTGVHVQKASKQPIKVTQTAQNLLDKLFKKAGFGIKLAQVSRTNTSDGHTVTVDGLQLFFDHTVSKVPQLMLGWPQGIPCPIEPITSKLPIDPCSGVGYSLDAKYHGLITLGEVSATSRADQSPNSTGPGPGTPSSTPTGSTTTGTVPAGSGPTGGGSLPPNPGVSSAPAPQGSAPTFPGAKPQASSDPLAGVSGRLLWFFPLMMIGLLAIAGRLRTPARLPRQV